MTWANLKFNLSFKQHQLFKNNLTWLLLQYIPSLYLWVPQNIRFCQNPRRARSTNTRNLQRRNTLKRTLLISACLPCSAPLRANVTLTTMIINSQLLSSHLLHRCINLYLSLVNSTCFMRRRWSRIKQRIRRKSIVRNLLKRRNVVSALKAKREAKAALKE